MKPTIGENIVKCRKLNGISQKYLAAKIGLSAQGLHKIEKGFVNPRTGTIEKIMTALCVTPNQLFGLEEINEDNISILYRIRKENQT